MATLLKVLNNLADIKSAGGVDVVSELRACRFRIKRSTRAILSALHMIAP